MKHLDFTIDFETCSLSANAAVMTVACLPWRRQANHNPFSAADGSAAAKEEDAWPRPFVGNVDLRSCVVDGFDFDPSTIKWWSERSETAKMSVTSGAPLHIADVLVELLDYIREFVAQYQLDSICLWCQGPDMDIAILRNLCQRYDINLNDTVPHTSFRDCRTIILEAAIIEATRRASHESPVPVCCDVIAAKEQKILADPSKAYALYAPLPDEYAAGRQAHDALYDCYRSSYNTWQALKWLKQ